MTETTAYIAIGRLSPGIGGPYQSAMNYRDALLSPDTRVEFVYIPVSGEKAVAGKALKAGWRCIFDATLTAWRLRRHHVVVFGVWHPVFFAFGAVGLVRRRADPPWTLVPTQSLSEWDWAKHSTRKRVLRPLVVLLLKSFNTVVFATEGEWLKSIPLLPRERATVIHHPVRQVRRLATASVPEPAICLLARLEPQKDVEM